MGRWPRFIKEQRETSTKTDATALIDGEGGVWPIMRMPSLAWQPSDFVISQAQARNSAVEQWCRIRKEPSSFPDFTQKTELGKGEIANRRRAGGATQRASNQLIRREGVRLIPRFRVS